MEEVLIKLGYALLAIGGSFAIAALIVWRYERRRMRLHRTKFINLQRRPR